MVRIRCLLGTIVASAALLHNCFVASASGLYAPKDSRVTQHAQQVFLTWDPEEQVETFTFQATISGNAPHFVFIVPTPSRPALHEMPRELFKHLAVFTTLKKRDYPQSKLLSVAQAPSVAATGLPGAGGAQTAPIDPSQQKPAEANAATPVIALMDHKVFDANRVNELFAWLRDNGYDFASDDATLKDYAAKQWAFTVLKLDARSLKRDKEGHYHAELAPVRFQFASKQLIYPMKLARSSAQEPLDVRLYVEAPYKTDLPGEGSYQSAWSALQRSAREGAAEKDAPMLKLFYALEKGESKKGSGSTTLEWARQLAPDDLKILAGLEPYSEKVPNVDEGFTPADVNDARRGSAVAKALQTRIGKARAERPSGYLVREAPKDEVRRLNELTDHLHAGQFLTRLHRSFSRGALNADLIFGPARVNGVNDASAYDEFLGPSR
jgi:hypothetical protein